MASSIPDITAWKEGVSVPSASYQLIVLLGGIETDISERLCSEPGIVDAADYQEGLSYVNEVSMTLNNEDEYLVNEVNKTGIFDSKDEIELYIYMYLDIPNFSHTQKLLNRIKKFGGWIKTKLTKTDNIKKTIDVTAVSYLGKADEISGARICTQRFNSDGLHLPEIYGAVDNAAIEGFPLKRGVHKIYAKFEGAVRSCKLDEGAWVTGTNITLVSADGKEKVQVKTYAPVVEGTEPYSIVVVLTEGDRYPFIMFRDPSVIEAVRKCFEIIGIPEADMDIEPYEIQTHDGRYEWQPYEPTSYPYWDALNPGAAISNGNNKVWIGFGNELLERDVVLHKQTTVHSFSADVEIKRMVYSPGTDYLFVFTESAGGPPWPRHLYRINLNNFDTEPILSRLDLMGIDVYNSLQWSEALSVFVFVRNAATISFLEIDGSINDIDSTLSRLHPGGMSWLWQNSGYIHYYFLRRNTGDTHYEIWRISYDTVAETWGAASFLAGWYEVPDVYDDTAIAYVFDAEQKVFIYKNIVAGTPVPLTIDMNNGNFDILNEGGDYELHSPLAWGQILKLIGIGADQVILTLKQGAITVDEAFTGTDRLIYDAIDVGVDKRNVQRLCITRNWTEHEILNVQAYDTPVLWRFSDWVGLYMEGDQDFTEMTVRNALQEIANTFLGFVRVNAERHGWFVRRGTYEGPNSITLKKAYRFQRGRETVYNEKYDGVAVDNGTARDEWGTFALEDNVLDLTYNRLPTIILKDVAKFYYDYYSIKRSLLNVGYLPTFLESEPMDFAEIEISGGNITGRIHEYAPGKSASGYKIMVEEA